MSSYYLLISTEYLFSVANEGVVVVGKLRENGVCAFTKACLYYVANFPTFINTVYYHRKYRIQQVHQLHFNLLGKKEYTESVSYGLLFVFDLLSLNTNCSVVPPLLLGIMLRILFVNNFCF